MAEDFDWTAGVVAIIGRLPDSGLLGPVGAGFVVSNGGLILTCAHVLAKTEWPHADWQTPLSVRFSGRRGSAGALALAGCFKSEVEGDIALLQLNGPLPDGVEPLLLGPAAGCEGQTVYFRGYPAGHDGVMGGDGHVLALETMKDGRQELQLQSQHASHGYSGGPVWDPARQRVIGLFQEGRTAPDPAGRLGYVAFAIPAETLVNLCPDHSAILNVKLAKQSTSRIP